MERSKESVIFLDTHVVIWIANGELHKLSLRAYEYISNNQVAISPFVRFELQYLKEIDRIRVEPKNLIQYLWDEIGLVEVNSSFSQVVDVASKITWTRDAFDRIIVADAELHDSPLITADKLIRKHFKNAIW